MPRQAPAAPPVAQPLYHVPLRYFFPKKPTPPFWCFERSPRLSAISELESVMFFRKKIVNPLESGMDVLPCEDRVRVAEGACRRLEAELRKCRDLLRAAEDESLKANQLLTILGWDEAAIEVPDE